MSFAKAWDEIYFFLLTLKRFYDQKYSYRASALAFTTLLGLVPLLLITVSFATIFPFFGEIAQLGERYVYTNFVPASAVEVQQYIHGFLQQASHLPTLNILFVIGTTLLLIHTISDSINDIWGLPPHTTSKLAILVPLYWIIVLLLPIAIGSSIFLATYLLSFNWYHHIYSATTQILIAFLPIPINTIILGAIYVIVPNTQVAWKNGLWGGFLAAILFEIARIGFAFYLQRFPSYSLIYGAFAVIPIFLIWLYIIWMIILYGAFFSYQLQNRYTASTY